MDPRIGVERRAHQPEGTVEPRLRGAQGDPEAGRDSGQWQVEVVMQDDQGSHLRFKPEEAAFELVAIRDPRLEAGNCREGAADIGQFDIDAMAPQPARLIDTGADEQAVEPGVECFGIAQRGQITPGADECVLHGVLGLFRVPQDQPGGGVQPGDRGACQRGKGVMIAPPCSLHEIPLHGSPSVRRPDRATRLVEYGEPGSLDRSVFVPTGAFPARYHRPALDSVGLAPAAVRGRVQEPARVKIHEADAKSLLVAQGLPVPPWDVARTPTQARSAAAKFLADPANATGKVVIKAQVLVGGRGKAGGVKLAGSADEAEDVAAEILALEIKGLPVRRVLVAPAADIVKEYYLSVLLDRATKRLMFIGSAEGGVEIEEVAAHNPEAIVYEHADPLLGLPDYAARELAFKIGFGTHWKAGATIAKGLLGTMIANDADLVEINPLAVIREHGAQGVPVERLVCLDAKITLDDSALSRHPGHEALRDLDAEDPADIEARRYDLTFIKLEGDIGCMVNGAGLAMATMDLVKRAGGEPANFLDIGGGAKADRVAAAMRLILDDPNVKAILVNIFGGITRGDEVARGLIEARAQQERDVPMVVRIVGTNAAEAAELLRAASFVTAATLDEAAEKAVAAARGVAA